MYQQIHEWVQANKERILQWNRDLVAQNSENHCPDGREFEAQEVVEKRMVEAGMTVDTFVLDDVPSLKQHAAYLEGRNYGSHRPNVVGVKRGTRTGKSLMFSGHIDTVPLGYDTWSVHPFGGEVIGDRQYGIGLYDMKSGIAAAIAALYCLQSLGYELDGDVFIESVVDEEFGGANGTLASRLRGYEANAAIIPEPTNLKICPANQGGIYYRFTFEGAPGRSYNGETLRNPIHAAARFIEIVEAYDTWRNRQPKNNPLFEGQTLPTLIQGIGAGNTDLDLFDRVPRRCTVDAWIQCLPGVSEADLFEELTSFIAPHVRADALLSTMPPVIERKIRFLPGSSIPVDHPIVQTLSDVCDTAIGREHRVQAAPFACDSFIFNHHAKTPAVIFGPTGANAHNVDEYIDIPDYLRLIECYALAILNWCGSSHKGGQSS